MLAGGWLGWQAGWSWQADLDVGPDLKQAGRLAGCPEPAISSPELSQKLKKKKKKNDFTYMVIFLVFS